MCGLCMHWECRERFPHHRLQRKPLVSDLGMNHGTCATHVSWCMSGSLTRGDGESVPGIPSARATRNCTYLARGPSVNKSHESLSADGITTMYNNRVHIFYWHTVSCVGKHCPEIYPESRVAIDILPRQYGCYFVATTFSNSFSCIEIVLFDTNSEVLLKQVHFYFACRGLYKNMVIPFVKNDH